MAEHHNFKVRNGLEVADSAILSGTLSVANDTTLSGSLTVSDSATLSGTLTVTDSAVFNNSITLNNEVYTTLLKDSDVTTLIDSSYVSARSSAGDGGIAMAIALG